MERMRIAGAFLLTVLVPAASAAEPRWIKLSTPDFTVFTTAGERRGREVLRQFQILRGFFYRNASPSESPENPVTVVVFRSEKESRPYRPNEYAPAFYQYGGGSDSIVIGDPREETFPVAAHEYIHLIVRRAGLNLPVWLNEGIADLYSTLRAKGAKTEVGAPIPGRLYALRAGALPIAQLAAVRTGSSHLQEDEQARVLYATSWALTHMLFLGDGYRSKWRDFFQAAGRGGDTTSLLRTIYGRPLEEIDGDLAAYVRGRWFTTAILDQSLSSPSESPEIAEADVTETTAVLARLLRLQGRKEQARLMLEPLASQVSGNGALQEELGYSAMAPGSDTSALTFFRRAAAQPGRGARFYFDYGMLELQNGDAGLAKAALRKSLDLQPGFVEAAINLAIRERLEGHFEAAIDALQRLKNIPEAKASHVYQLMATCWLQLGNREAALEAAERAESLAPTEASRQAAAKLVTAAQPLDRSPAKLSLGSFEGMLEELECLPEGVRLRIRAGEASRLFLVDQPSRVRIEGLKGVRVDLPCGAQEAKPVVVWFDPAAPAGFAGIVRRLTFVR